jgi:hypothetical protein
MVVENLDRTLDNTVRFNFRVPELTLTVLLKFMPLSKCPNRVSRRPT